jgi:hypothetical protein
VQAGLIRRFFGNGLDWAQQLQRPCAPGAQHTMHARWMFYLMQASFLCRAQEPPGQGSRPQFFTTWAALIQREFVQSAQRSLWCKIGEFRWRQSHSEILFLPLAYPHPLSPRLQSTSICCCWCVCVCVCVCMCVCVYVCVFVCVCVPVSFVTSAERRLAS